MNSKLFTETSWLRKALLAGAVVAIALVAALLPSGPASAQDPVTGAGEMNNSLASALGLNQAPPAKTNLLDRTLAATNAAAAWDELTQSAVRPPIPDAWQTDEPEPEVANHYFLPYTVALADRSKDFYTRFPTDTNALEAKQLEMRALSMAVKFGDTNQQVRFEATEKIVLADTNLAEDDRFDIRMNDIQRSEEDKEQDADSEVAMFAVFEKDTRALQKEFPNHPEVLDRLMTVAELSDPDKSREIARELLSNTNTPDEIRDAATNIEAQLDRVGKPLPLQFSAVDGRAVDMAKLQGKVVLVDFWATWCKPCMEEFPDVLSAYDQYHPKGLEIVGISFDDEKETLTNFLATQKVEWPQYFDGTAMETNKYAKEFGIGGIPTQWLVDKKGVLRYINARFDLTNKIERLMAE